MWLLHLQDGHDQPPGQLMELSSISDCNKAQIKPFFTTKEFLHKLSETITETQLRDPEAHCHAIHLPPSPHVSA